MNKGLDVVDYIIDLYNMYDDKGHNKAAQTMRANATEYDKAFSDYTLDDVKNAVDKLFRYKSDKTRPTVAQILSYLKTENTPTYKKETIDRPKCEMYKYQDIYEDFVKFSHFEGYVFSQYFDSQGLVFGNDCVLIDGQFSKKHYKWETATKKCRYEHPEYYIDVDNFNMEQGHKLKIEMAIAHSLHYF